MVLMLKYRSPFLSPFAFGFLVARTRQVLTFPLRYTATDARIAGDGPMGLDRSTALSL